MLVATPPFFLPPNPTGKKSTWHTIGGVVGGGGGGGYIMQFAITRTRKETLLAYSVTLRQCVLDLTAQH